MNVESILRRCFPPNECVKVKSETTSKTDENKMKKEIKILKSDNLLVSEYATHFWMRASVASI